MMPPAPRISRAFTKQKQGMCMQQGVSACVTCGWGAAALVSLSSTPSVFGEQHQDQQTPPAAHGSQP